MNELQKQIKGKKVVELTQKELMTEQEKMINQKLLKELENLKEFEKKSIENYEIKIVN